MGQSQSEVLTVETLQDIPLYVEIEATTGSGEIADASIVLRLDLTSETVLAGPTALSSAISVTATVEESGDANVSVVTGAASTPVVNVSPSAASTNSQSATESDVDASVQQQVALVTDVIDGETIDVDIDGQSARVRYILIDAPERDEALYAEAIAANQQLVAGQVVRLERDVSTTDRFGRLLRYVYLADGTFINAEMVRQGYAGLAVSPPDVAEEATIRAAQATAIAAGAGLWGLEGAALLPRANSNANLRTGPGTGYRAVGAVQAGDVLDVVAMDRSAEWYQLENRFWIAAFLVDNAPGNLPITTASVTSAASYAPVATAIPTPSPTPTFISNMAATPIVVQPPPGVAQPTPIPPTATPTTQSAPAQSAPSQQVNCEPSYPDFCIPLYQPDLDCDEIGYKNFRVDQPDPHDFDRDEDGIGCET